MRVKLPLVLCTDDGCEETVTDVITLQFRENLADRQAAEAVRARIDWKYLLGLDLTDSGFDFSALSEFRDRLRAGSAVEHLLDKLLERCRTLGLLKARGQQTSS